MKPDKEAVARIIIPDMLRASSNRLRARFVRKANNKEMGAVKAVIPEEKDALARNVPIGVTLLVTSVTNRDQRATTATVGSTAPAVGDASHPIKCF